MRSFASLSLILAVALVFVTSPRSAKADLEAGQVLLIDFGANTNSTSDPDEVWNNVTSDVGSTDDGELTNLITTAGDPLNVSLVMLNRFNGANTNGTTAVAALYPGSATRDSLYGNTEAFNGLADIFP